MSPYIRKGKTVYKKEDGHLKSKGTSKDVETAKAHLRALYANEGSRGDNRKRTKK